VNGKVSETLAPDGERGHPRGAVKDIFSNFLDKSPDSLFRRIDPDYHYPTFGDDSVVEEMAPTLGKFYVKASRAENYGLWGNFTVGYLGTSWPRWTAACTAPTRTTLRERPPSFGERRFAADAFAAEPGPVSSYEEYRGTGGSLYFLRHQDILQGSERVRIEIRDKDSGIVTGVVHAAAVIDYDIDYLQGRLLLTAAALLHRGRQPAGAHQRPLGDEAHLVVRYEFTPASTSWTPWPWAARATTGSATTCGSASPPTPTRKGTPTAPWARRT
jgi:hypothetical protein